MPRLEGMAGGTFVDWLNDLMASATTAVDVPDVIKGIDEDNVFVIHDMVEVTKDVETLFPTTDGGIIENNGLEVAVSVVGGVDQEFEFEDIGKEDPDWMFKPGNSGGICGTEGITCPYKGFWEGGCSTFTGRDLNFIV